MMKSLAIVVFLSFTAVNLSGQSAANTWSVKFSDAILSRYTPTINAMTGKGWEYSNSIVLLGIEKVYERMPTANAAYLNYIQAYVDTYVNSSGTISPAIASSLDAIHPGILCLFLYQKTGLAKYKTAATYLRNYLMGASSTYPKTPDGGYWHKNSTTYSNTMMLDGIFMAHTFLVKYGAMFNDNLCFDTATNQTLMLASHLYDNTRKLALHAWNSDKTKAWANATTGNSSEVWSRGMGWYVVALVEMLSSLPPTHPQYNNIKTLLGNLITGLQTYQDPATGLWYQVVDKGTSAGNYLETSGSAMFVYAIKTAVDNFWVSNSFLTVAQNGWTGLKTQISTYTDGKPQINQFAPAMSVQNNYTGYVSILPVNSPTASGTQHPHGYAGILLAASAMEFPLTTMPVKFTGFTAKQNGNNVLLNWKNQDDNEADYHAIEYSTNGTDFTTLDKIKANGSGVYNYDHKNCAAAIRYYRIKAVSIDQSVLFSTTLIVKMQKTQPRISISPNPATAGPLNMRFENMVPGRYTITIVNTSGVKIIEKKFQILSREVAELKAVLPSVGKGLYYVKTQAAGFLNTKTILIN